MPQTRLLSRLCTGGQDSERRMFWAVQWVPGHPQRSDTKAIGPSDSFMHGGASV